MRGADLELFARAVAHAVDRHRGPDLDAALEQIGWRDALDAAPSAAVSVLFDLLGRANATCAALDRVVCRGMPEAGAVVLPPLGAWHPPGVLVGRELHVHGLGTARIGPSPTAVVVHGEPGDEHACVVETQRLEQRHVDGVAPALGLVEVSGVVSADAAVPVDWTAAVASGRLALGHDLVGTARRMLELAREHAIERVQFGRPIASFQAVRHRLAETFVAIEGAEAALAEAWDDGSPIAAATAKAIAGRAARAAAVHCQQVMAGIGFTTEHPLHLSVRRSLVDDQLLGSSRQLAVALGTAIVESRRLPTAHPL